MKAELDTTQLRQYDHKEQPELKPGRILVGTAVALDLDEEVKKGLADQIHAYLEEQKENMEVIKPKILFANMNQGLTVVKIGDNNELLGFAQLSADYPDDRTVVVGTWLGIKHPDYENGSGAAVMEHAAELAFNSKHFPVVRNVITRVRQDNEAPQKVLMRIGAEPNGLPKISPKTGNLVQEYNLNMVGLRRVQK